MGSGRKKIEIKKIEKAASRMVTFSKRRKGLFKKSQELQDKTGAKVAIIVFSPAGNPYTMGDVSLIDTAVKGISCTVPDAVGDFSAASGGFECKQVGTSGFGAASGGFECEQVGNAFAASTSYSNSNTGAGLREWLDSIDVDGCNEIDQLLHLKEQLKAVKERIHSTELNQ